MLSEFVDVHYLAIYEAVRGPGIKMWNSQRPPDKYQKITVNLKRRLVDKNDFSTPGCDDEGNTPDFSPVGRLLEERVSHLQPLINEVKVNSIGNNCVQSWNKHHNLAVSDVISTHHRAMTEISGPR